MGALAAVAAHAVPPTGEGEGGGGLLCGCSCLKALRGLVPARVCLLLLLPCGAQLDLLGAGSITTGRLLWHYYCSWESEESQMRPVSACIACIM